MTRMCPGGVPGWNGSVSSARAVRVLAEGGDYGGTHRPLEEECESARVRKWALSRARMCNVTMPPDQALCTSGCARGTTAATF
jgi:hypothetical protein